MKLSTQAINEFIELYEKECGARLTEQEAQELGTRLIDVKAVYYPTEPEKNKYMRPPTPQLRIRAVLTTPFFLSE